MLLIHDFFKVWNFFADRPLAVMTHDSPIRNAAHSVAPLKFHLARLWVWERGAGTSGWGLLV